MDWSRLPDLIAVGLLVGAFASVARRNHTPVSVLWLKGWMLILLHFFAFMLGSLPAPWGEFSIFAGTLALICAGFLFMRASVPFRERLSSIAMLWTVIAVYTLYAIALMYSGPIWLLTVSAVLLGLGPLAVALSAMKRFTHPLRWFFVGLQCTLAAVLLVLQHRPDGGDLALDAVLFAVYLSASVHFWQIYRRATAGAIITTVGFFLWAGVFAIGPIMSAYAANVHIESEVWNLPKYIVALGMILLLLEEQVAYNKHLALHDELTGLPNRRLFHDRLAIALERARRNRTQTALLTIDLDHFKQVNDTLGHHVGDLLLQNVAKLFSARIRRSDTMARTGGDEFAIILDAPTSHAEAAVVGRSLLDILHVPMTLQDKTVRVGASLGIAVFPTDGEDIEALCIKADLRMYDDKRSHNLGAEHGPTDISHGSSRRERGAGVIS